MRTAPCTWPEGTFCGDACDEAACAGCGCCGESCASAPRARHARNARIAIRTVFPGMALNLQFHLARKPPSEFAAVPRNETYRASGKIERMKKEWISVLPVARTG